MHAFRSKKVRIFEIDMQNPSFGIIILHRRFWSIFRLLHFVKL